MAITTIDGVIAGGKPPIYYRSSNSGGLGEPPWYTPFYLASVPGAAIAPTPGIAGAALTSYAGQIPFTNPVSGSTYLTRFSATPIMNGGAAMMADRLWHNSGISLSVTTSQTVNSVAFPARDINQSTNGEGVYLGLEISSTVGSGSPTITVTYTNSAGTSGRTGTNIPLTSSGQPTGTFFPIGLAAGDTGVQSVQSIQFSQAYGTGTVHLVAYRPICHITSIPYAISMGVDCLTGAMPELFNNSVPFLLFRPESTQDTSFESLIVYSQG